MDMMDGVSGPSVCVVGSSDKCNAFSVSQVNICTAKKTFWIGKKVEPTTLNVLLWSLESQDEQDSWETTSDILVDISSPQQTT